MKKYIAYIISCAITLGAISSCGSKSKTDSSSGDTTLQTEVKTDPPLKKYVKLAEKANASMPVILPGGIRMDRAEAVSAKEYKYVYTFTQDPVVSLEDFIKATKPAISLGMREQKGEDLDMFRKDKMTVIYAYYKLDGSLFAEVKINPEDYIK